MLFAGCFLQNRKYQGTDVSTSLVTVNHFQPEQLLSARDQSSPTLLKILFGPLSPSLNAYPGKKYPSETRRLILEFPTRIRAGDTDLIQLSLVLDDSENVSSMEDATGQSDSDDKNPDVYDTHRVIANARLDLAGMQIRPSDDISEPLLRGQSVTFYWLIGSREVGVHRGTAWLFLGYVDKVTGEERYKAVSAQILEIEVDKIFGISAPQARILGFLGSTMGFVLAYPSLTATLKRILKALRI